MGGWYLTQKRERGKKIPNPKQLLTKLWPGRLQFQLTSIKRQARAVSGGVISATKTINLANEKTAPGSGE